MNDNGFKPPLNLSPETLQKLTEQIKVVDSMSKPIQNILPSQSIPKFDKLEQKIKVEFPKTTKTESFLERHKHKIMLILFIFNFIQSIVIFLLSKS